MLVLTFMVQFGGARFHPGHVSLLAPLAMLVFVAAFGIVFVRGLERIVPAVRAILHSWRGRRSRLWAAANAERRARALMSELCPHGWRAQITLLEAPGEEVPTTADGQRARVALDWVELKDESGRPAVIRRMWAQTISEALDAMVADRRTDETLEQIERGAVADGARWPDL